MFLCSFSLEKRNCKNKFVSGFNNRREEAFRLDKPDNCLIVTKKILILPGVQYTLNIGLDNSDLKHLNLNIPLNDFFWKIKKCIKLEGSRNSPFNTVKKKLNQIIRL